MNDLDTISDILRCRGYREVHIDDLPSLDLDGPSFAICRPPDAGHEGAASIELSPGSGYGGFRCSLLFEADGRLIGHAVWE
jgi:hypothetical protein